MRSNLSCRYPELGVLKRRAKKRLPKFVWEYLDSATGNELSKIIDRQAFDRLIIDPAILQGDFTPCLEVSFLGKKYSVPFGVAPVGMSGLIYPNAEKILASLATSVGMPYSLSTMATICPEQLSAAMCERTWFQLYCPEDEAIMQDMLARAGDRGIETLVVTVDLPGPSVRERQLASGLSIPPKWNYGVLRDCIFHPAWALKRLFYGPIGLPTLSKYSPVKSLASTDHIGYRMRCNPDPAYIAKIRDRWNGKLILKGVSSPQQLSFQNDLGLDAVWVSNHAGRQFQSGRSSVSALRAVRSVTDLPIIFDGGVESGLDIIKALSLGANFVMLGRAWHYGLAALGKEGARVVTRILERDLIANMHQLGCRDLHTLPQIESGLPR